MPEAWMPGLRHDPGLNAGYNAGTNRMRMVVDHWTAGRDSYGICKNQGLCQILLPKVGVPWQFAEINAKCWHAGSSAYGDYNDDGPGLEVERLGGHEPLTPDQTHWLGRINAWMASEWGVPNVHYWGPQFPWHGADFHGHVNHAQIHANADGLSPAEWDAISGGTSPTPTPDDDGGETVEVTSGITDTKGVTHLFCVGTDGNLYWTHARAAEDFGHWQDLGQAINDVSALPVATLAHYGPNADGCITVVCRNSSREAWVRRYFDDGGGWSAWAKIGGNIADPKL